MIFDCANEGKPMNVRDSITSKDEKLTNKQLKNQWNNIDWKTAEKFVNRLQSRIAKAVIKCKWSLVKRLQYLLTLMSTDLLGYIHSINYETGTKFRNLLT